MLITPPYLGFSTAVVVAEGVTDDVGGAVTVEVVACEVVAVGAQDAKNSIAEASITISIVPSLRTGFLL